MFNNISWQSYWIVIALLSAAYYITVLLLYYRNDIKEGILRKRSYAPEGSASPNFLKKEASIKEVQPSLFNEGINDLQPSKKGSEKDIVYACMDEINAFLNEVKRSKCIKEELIYSLQNILRKYPTLKEYEYKASLNNIIQTQCKQYCSIHLNAEDIVGLWVE